MEVVIPNSQDFEFGSSTLTSPYSSMPTTPARFGAGAGAGDYFFSAPTSPSRMSDFYRDLEELSAGYVEAYGPPSPPAVPYKWEANPGTPKSPGDDKNENDGENDFAFDFSEDLERTSLSADELFDDGKIRPLKPPPRLQTVGRSAAAPERGRERVNSSASGRRATRSLSPLRVSEYHWENDGNDHRVGSDKRQPIVSGATATTAKQQILALFSKPSFWSSPSSSSSSSSSKKWKLRDFLLFRSASEGRATDKDPFKKYTNMYRQSGKSKGDQSASFGSTESFGSGQQRRRKSGSAVSAHALHYTVNKAVSEDLKKKTFLPYKQGILGRLAFNPAVHALANGFGSLTRA